MRTLIFSSFILLASFGMPLFASAGTVGGVTTVTLTNPLNITCTSNETCISTFVAGLMDFIVRIGTVIVILMLVFVGYKFVMAQGEPGKISEARQALLWTIVGALILLGAKAISLGILATVQAIGS